MATSFLLWGLELLSPGGHLHNIFYTLDMHKHEHLKALVVAIIGFENGQQPYTAAQLDKALTLAGVEPPARNLQQSRTVRGGKAATAATVGLGALEAAKEALDPARDALQTLVPYLDVAKWLLLAITLTR